MRDRRTRATRRITWRRRRDDIAARRDRRHARRGEASADGADAREGDGAPQRRARPSRWPAQSPAVGADRRGGAGRWRRRSERRRRVSRFYLTTAIDYANGDPHIGHAYEKIGADAIARYRRLRGDDVHFLIGHGRARAEGRADGGRARRRRRRQLVDDDRRALPGDVGAARRSRTTSSSAPPTPTHKAGVRALIERIFERNPDDFYEKAYEGWYCVGCESFKQDAEIVDGKCVLHPTRTLEWVEERNWFFRLSEYAGFLTRAVTERPEFLQPESRRNEMLALLEQGLEDISASRSRFSWGVPFPRR